MNLINTKDDIDWLFSTHLKKFKEWRGKAKSALVYGNEDAPDMVKLFTKKMPLVDDPSIANFVSDSDGDLQLVKSNPDVHIDINSHNARGSGKLKTNPVSNSKRNAETAAQGNADYFNTPYVVFSDTSGNWRVERFTTQNVPLQKVFYPKALKRNPAKKKKPRTAAQKAATARMLAARKHAPKHVRTPAQKKARKAANTVPGYYPNPSSKRQPLALHPTERAITQDDINAAIRGNRMLTASAAELRAFINDFKNSPHFAGRVTAAAAKQMLQAKRRTGLLTNPIGRGHIKVETKAPAASRWKLVANFVEKSKAMEYARAIHARFPSLSVRVVA